MRTADRWMRTSLVAASLMLWACTTDAEGDVPTCVEGRTAPCMCPDGDSMGVQECEPDGTWGPCDCDGAGEQLDAGDDADTETSDDVGDADAGDSDTEDGGDGTTNADEPDEDVLYLHEDFSGIDGDPCDGVGEWFESIRVQDEHCDEALNLVDDPVRYGDESLQLHAKNPEQWNYDEVNSYRVEVGTHANRWEMWNDDPPFNVVGEPIWFSFSVYVPEDWEFYGDEGIETINIAEFHANSLPDHMYEDPFTSGHRKPWVMDIWDDEFVFHNGYLSEDGGTDEERASVETVDGIEVEPGSWTDVVVNVEWADGDDAHDGFMDIWVDGDHVYDYEGPTLLDSEHPPRPLKLSIYNSQWGGSDGFVDERTLIFDDVRFGWAEASYPDMVAGKD